MTPEVNKSQNVVLTGIGQQQNKEMIATTPEQLKNKLVIDISKTYRPPLSKGEFMLLGALLIPTAGIVPFLYMIYKAIADLKSEISIAYTTRQLKKTLPEGTRIPNKEELVKEGQLLRFSEYCRKQIDEPKLPPEKLKYETEGYFKLKSVMEKISEKTKEWISDGITMEWPVYKKTGDPYIILTAQEIESYSKYHKDFVENNLTRAITILQSMLKRNEELLESHRDTIYTEKPKEPESV